MMETSEPSPWCVLALALVAACALRPTTASRESVPVWGCPVVQPHAVGPGAGGSASHPVELLPPVTATAQVCIYCTGVAPADGHVYATIYMTIDARTATTDLRVASLELLDAQGAVVAHGAPPAYVGVVTSGHADVGPFSGRLAAGAHTVLWTGSRLDVGDGALRRLPSFYRLHLVAGGTALIVDGAMAPQGATA